MTSEERRNILDSLPLPRRELAELFLHLIQAYQSASALGGVVGIDICPSPDIGIIAA